MTTVSKRFLPLLMACFLLLPAAIRPIPHVNAQVPSYSPNPPVLSKSFNPSTIPVGGTSRLTISLQNIDTASALTQVILTDTLPDHVVLANPVSPSLNGCGIAGTLTADNGDRELTLNNATIAAGSTCTISVYVTSSEHGVHTNTIPAGAVISREGVTNTNAAVDTLTVISEPQLQVIKTVANTGPFVLNDTITYNIELVNNGNVTLTGVTVTDTGMGTILDPDTCTIAIPADLEPGQSLRCTASHVITPEDVAAGTYINTAVGESVQTGPVEDSVTVPVANTTGLTMKKTVTSNGYYSPGSAITYDIVLQNIGSETLSNVQVTDPGAVLGECNPPLGSALESGESMTCKASHTITQADIDAGSYTNTAYAYANGGSTPLSSDSVKINFTQIPHPTLVITTRLNLDEAGPDNRVDEGDTITYTFTVKNSGNVTLTNISLTSLTPGLTISGGPIASLEPGESDSTTFTASYTLSQEVIDQGSFTISAQASGSPPTGSVVNAQASHTQPLEAKPAVALTKMGVVDPAVKAPFTIANPGDPIRYTFTVENTGNVTLQDVTLNDPDAVITTSAVPAVISVDGHTATITSLAPGETATLTGYYVTVVDDFVTGSYENTATVTGTLPHGRTLPGGETTVTAMDDHNEALVADPEIALSTNGALNLGIAGPTDRIDAGDAIEYTFTVTNTGNVPLTNISLTSLTPGLTISGGPIASLEPGEIDNTTFTASYTLSQEIIDQGSFTISAQASGSSPTGSVVNAQASHTQPLEAKPAVALTKMGVVDPAVKAPFTIANPGDPIRYTFTVENTGNVTLQDVTLNDPDAVITTSAVPAVISVDRHTATITSLAPGETVTISGYRIILVDDFRRTFYKNTATVTGTLPIGRTLPDGQTTVTAMDDHNEVLVADPKIELNTNSTINMAKAGLPDRIDAGDTIEYTFTVTNTGNVPLTDITLTGLVPGVTVSGGPIAELDAGEIDNTTFTASYTLTQMDVDAGSFTNRSEVTGIFSTMDIIDEDEITTPLAPVQRIGAAKRVVGSPVEVSTGVWDVTFEVRIKNYSNVTLSQLQVSEDLSAALPIRKPEDAYAGITPLPAVASFQVQSVTSADFTPNPNFNGSDDKNLLAGRDVLAPDEEGVVQFVVRVTPITGGPFENSVTVSAVAPDNNTVEGRSQNGANPDPDNDGDPTNNNAPTPVGFGNLFQPPVGEKHVATIIGLLQWTMEWMNSANIQPLPVMVYDPIPLGAVYQPSGVPSGYPLPAGQLPSGSTSVGVTCTAASTATKTTACYYEGPTAEFPRGRVIWQGILAPDYQAADMQSAANKITIRFATRVDGGARQIHNTAAAGADLNGDGNISGSAELKIAVAAAEWVRPTELPLTGFAPGVTSYLPPQPVEKAYQQAGDIRLEIPALSVNVPVVGVPLTDGQWDVSWLGKTAGHLAGTGLPTWQGNAVITAHVYDASGLPGPFANLNQLRWGDKILLHAFGSVYEYEVRTARRVQPNDFSIMETQKGAWVTLITCESYDETSASYRYRFAVQAVLLQVRPAGQ